MAELEITLANICYQAPVYQGPTNARTEKKPLDF